MKRKVYSFNPLLAEIGQRIRECREVRGMTATDLAYAAGLTSSQLSLYESGHVGMSVEKLCGIAETLQIPLSTLQPARLDPFGAATRDMETLSGQIGSLPPEKREKLCAIVRQMLEML